MPRLVSIQAQDRFRLMLRFSEGVNGVVDLADLAGRGVFELWNNPGKFAQARITDHGGVAWGPDVDLCPDMLYMRLTGKRPEQVFESLAVIAGQ